MDPRDQRPGALATLKRTAAEFREDDLSDWAAALTFYGLLALFPALIAFVGLFGLFADPASATATITDIVEQIGSASSAETFSAPIESVTANEGTAGVMAIAGFAVALWSASGYVSAFSRASNVIYERDEGRPFWKLRPLQLLVTFAIVVLATVTLLALLASGPLAEAIGEQLGISATAVTIYQFAKWPVLLGLVLAILSILYFAAPNAKLRGFRWVTPGSVAALTIWVLASAAFALYVANFGSYDETYGTLGGVVVLLMWLWITNLAILFGAQLDAELERGREIAEGVPWAEYEIQLEPRSEPDGERLEPRPEPNPESETPKTAR